MQWFGAAQFGGDLNLQEKHAGQVLKYLQADILGVCEVVDTARFGRMIRQSLGNDYRYQMSPYSAIDQKLAFVYNRHIFRRVLARPFMSVSTTAYYNFASGRFPFLLSCDMVVNGQRKRVHFIMLHAKANADPSAYSKRQAGAVELKDSLDTYFHGQPCFVLGDFNDYFNGSMVTGKTSPYQNFLADTGWYKAITLPLNKPGYQTTLHYQNAVIDQQIVSGDFKKWYVEGSVWIRTDVVDRIPGYLSGNTSDHYPVSSSYNIQP